MAITTLSGAKTGLTQPSIVAKNSISSAVAGTFLTYWAQAGRPAAGAYDTTLNGVTLSSASTPVTGQIPYVHPASGNSHLGRIKIGSNVKGSIWLCDRIWHNGGYTITSTAAQNITSPTWPARDVAGSTNGDGILLAVEVSASVGAGAPTITISYTNSDGTAGRSGTNIYVTAGSSVATRVYPIGLQAGDTGVRSVQSLTLSQSWTSGTINLVAFRVLAILPIKDAGRTVLIDSLTAGMPQLHSGAVPYIMVHRETSTSAFLSGDVTFTQG